ncbi:hypothetical protein F3Y22_tig00110621pilonHSYRG00290 [Hibiscus syriacus]|uniref:Uncharacterized protein n=1 Tax=Hibiscus syriacus TaxID=106335 RepID=A0A6A2ZZJ8_HIBSY|nr:hypothetical protein F3Y22_tig00110621pilonHSYRG00290 [Hibiscus syriacus]
MHEVIGNRISPDGFTCGRICKTGKLDRLPLRVSGKESLKMAIYLNRISITNGSSHSADSIVALIRCYCKQSDIDKAVSFLSFFAKEFQIINTENYIFSCENIYRVVIWIS